MDTSNLSNVLLPYWNHVCPISAVAIIAHNSFWTFRSANNAQHGFPTLLNLLKFLCRNLWRDLQRTYALCSSEPTAKLTGRVLGFSHRGDASSSHFAWHPCGASTWNPGFQALADSATSMEFVRLGTPKQAKWIKILFNHPVTKIEKGWYTPKFIPSKETTLGDLVHTIWCGPWLAVARRSRFAQTEPFEEGTGCLVLRYGSYAFLSTAWICMTYFQPPHACIDIQNSECMYLHLHLFDIN